MTDTSTLLRALTPRLVATLTRRYGDFAACEDAAQEALVAACSQWPIEGVPESPLGWLVRVASRRITDTTRSEAARRARERLVVSAISMDDQLALAADEAALSPRDETLILLLLCCHPALSAPVAVALTLRVVAGLSTSEIAKAFFVSEPTMGQRLSRAKQSIRAAGARFEWPAPDELPQRIALVRHALYLLFNEGYTASSGPALVRVDLSEEAIRLARVLCDVASDDAESLGLLALMLLTDARRMARVDAQGALVPLDEQDRTRWNAELIAEGEALLERAMRVGPPGPLQIQAAIAALHDRAESAERTDWPQILALYDALIAMQDSPMARLSRIVAVAMAHEINGALRELDALCADPRMRDHHRAHAVRAHLLERAGRTSEAIEHFVIAARTTTSAVERDFLSLRAARLRDAAR